jgi:predicted transglutaminase-like cysteine proteinase
MQKQIILGVAILCAALSVFTAAQAEEVTSIDAHSAYAPIGKPSSVPIGWKLFCNAQPDECVPSGTGAQSVKLDSFAWRQLVSINTLANNGIEGVADTDHYDLHRLGIPNWWTYPDDGKGNCNDYSLLKRRLLIEAGWPKAALLLTVVLDHHGDGHLVLTVKTNAGDLILDNLNAEIVRWDETGYTFLKRQSPANPNVWLAIDTKVAATASASLR